MLRKFFASFLVSIFVLVFIPVNLALGSFITFFEEDFYRGEFADTVYSFFMDQIPQKIDVAVFSPLTHEKLKEIFAEVYMREDILMVIDDIIAQIKDSEEETLKVNVSFRPLLDKSDLVSEKIAEYLYSNLELCENYDDFSNGNVDCLQPDMAQVDFENRVAFTFDKQVLSVLPDQFVFDAHMSKENFQKMIFNVLGAGILILVLILVLIAFVIYKPWHKIFKWEGKALATASIVLLILVFNMIVLPQTFLQDSMQAVYLSFYVLIFGSLASKLVYYVVPVFVVGLIMWIGGKFYDKDVNNEYTS